MRQVNRLLSIVSHIPGGRVVAIVQFVNPIDRTGQVITVALFQASFVPIT
jgi:hypothetical protein